MSSSATAPTSTTGSSTSSPSRADRLALVACGAIAQPCATIAERRGWPLDVVPLPPLLHNHPERIADAVEQAVDRLEPDYGRVAVGYADCGSYGALDDLCERRGLARLPGLHCYDVYGGSDRLAAMFEDDPGTYVLTDFLVRSFDRTVVTELGLDRHPELRDDYFRHYTRMVWLAQQPDDELHRVADRAAHRIGLPLTVVETGTHRLERALEALL
ncbi:MAG: DUF1638 domain-containing protein [Nocardioidaceae bacterium]|nr:DUF1638 domain-containing protein [Nocardioidaceae bacterium]